MWHDSSEKASEALLEAALQYAGRGWRVFPCCSILPDGSCTCGRPACADPGKHPRIRVWQRNATTDARQVAAWWRKWPLSNVAIVADRLVVADLDSAEQIAQLRKIALESGGLPTTLVGRTGRGFHLYFVGSLPGSRVVDGILVRGQGGYVLAPPSRHVSGVVYEWLNNEMPADLPEWVYGWLETGGNGAKARPSVRLPTVLPTYIVNKPKGVENKISSAVAAMREPWSTAIEARIATALAAIPADCNRDTWLRVGMALHDCGWDDGTTDRGFEIWVAWSATGRKKFKGEHDLETRWRSFGQPGRGGVTLGSLFHIAREAGWNSTGKEVMRNESENGTGPTHNTKPPPDNVAPAGAFHEGSGVNGTVINFGPLKSPIVWPDQDRFGRAKPTCRNARAAIRHLGLDCQHDTFHDRLSVSGHPIAQWAGELNDNAVHMLRDLMNREYGLDCGTQHTMDAAVQECLCGPVDPVRQYLETAQRQYDGTPRLRGWLTRYLGAEPTPLNEAFGSLVLAAACRRVRQPGTKFDEIMVLVGPEGQGKSTAIEILAGTENFSDQEILTLDERRQQEALQGVWLYEIGELNGIGRADVDKVKSFASRRVDRCRPAYGRTRMDRPRRCVLLATVNHDTFLKGETGNRRFWPVETGQLDLPALARDRDQLWGEAATVEAAGGSIRLPETLWGAARDVQDSRREHDPWEDALSGIAGRTESKDKNPYRNPQTQAPEARVTTQEIVESWLRLPADRWTPVTAKRVAFIMRRLGWDGPRVMKHDYLVMRGFARPV